MYTHSFFFVEIKLKKGKMAPNRVVCLSVQTLVETQKYIKLLLKLRLSKIKMSCKIYKQIKCRYIFIQKNN